MKKPQPAEASRGYCRTRDEKERERFEKIQSDVSYRRNSGSLSEFRPNMCKSINPGPPAPRAAQVRRFFSHCRVRFCLSPYNTLLPRRGDAHAAALRSITLESFALNAYRLHCAARGKKQLPLLSQGVTFTGSTTDDALGKTTFDGISTTRGNATQRVNTTNIAKKRIRLCLRLICGIPF